MWKKKVLCIVISVLRSVVSQKWLLNQADFCWSAEWTCVTNLNMSRSACVTPICTDSYINHWNWPKTFLHSISRHNCTFSPPLFASVSCFPRYPCVYKPYCFLCSSSGVVLIWWCAQFCSLHFYCFDCYHLK